MNAPWSAATDEAAALAEVAWVLLAGVAAIFAATMGALALGLRARKPAVPARWWIVGGGIVVPVVLLSALLAYSTWRTVGLDRGPADPLVVSVTGRMWWWEIRYRNPADGAELRMANELHLPLGRPVQLGLTSADVIHSVWVPALGGKMDTVPGRVNRLVFTPRRAGVYRGSCAEFCGEQHARMALHVVVQPPAQFDAWLARQARPAQTTSDATLAQGRRAFVERGCAGCHAVRGVAPGGTLAPDLTHVGSRLHLGAGVLPNDRAAIARWIVGVQALKPGAHMPAMRDADAATLDALAAWLASLQ
ncbi:MAG TPA: cytochrome c oxidase subunit II [Albitalea sp.]|uniref:cytochrome c oxidase subunit II n=1 Tax=Piscinibacter sp. TaxID=1903157 RepID=UPI002ED670E9